MYGLERGSQYVGGPHQRGGQSYARGLVGVSQTHGVVQKQITWWTLLPDDVADRTPQPRNHCSTFVQEQDSAERQMTEVETQ